MKSRLSLCHRFSPPFVALALLTAMPVSADQETATWVPAGSSGFWFDPSHWSGGAVPNNGSTTYAVVIDGEPASASHVDLTVSLFVDSLDISAGDSLTVGNGSVLFVVTDGLRFDGTMALGSTDNASSLVVNGPFTLGGTGELSMSDSTLNSLTTNNSIITVGPSLTVRGAGQFLQASGGLLNTGVIRQEGTNTLTIDPNALGVVNQGQLVGAGTGGLILYAGSFDNTNGTILAEDGSFVQLGPSADFTSGTLTTVGTGTIRPVGEGGNAPLLVSGTLGGIIDQGQEQDFRLRGTITNNAAWNVNHAGTGSAVVQLEGDVTLRGNGSLAFQGAGPQNLYSNGATFTNEAGHTIRGGGATILGDTGGLVNKGTIRQEGDNPIVIDPDWHGVTNTGSLEGAGSGGLQLVAGTFTNTGGLVVASAGSSVTLGPSLSLVGGTINTAGSGVLRPTGDGGGAPVLTDVTNSGQVAQAEGNDAYIRGTLANDGTWTVSQEGAGEAVIEFDDGATLRGNGQLVFSGSGEQTVRTNGTTFVHSGNHILRGGSLNLLQGTGGMLNRGYIVQEGALPITIDPNGLGFTNEAIVDAWGSGGIRLVSGTFTNTHGLIEALAGSFVAVGPSATVVEGILLAYPGAAIRPTGDGGGAPVLQDVTVFGDVDQRQDQDAYVLGTLHNNGNWVVNHSVAAGSSFIEFDNGAAVTGPGSINFLGTGPQAILTNNTMMRQAAGHTIHGGGVEILQNTGGFDNQGTVRQEGAHPMTIDPNGFGFTNEATLEAAGAGGLHLVQGEFRNNGGTIVADAGSFVAIGPGCTVTGGTLTSVDDGEIRPVGDGGNSPVLFNVTTSGTLTQGQDQDARLYGQITNNASWTVTHTGASGDAHVEINGNSIITGAGELVFAGNGSQAIYTDNTTFANGPQHTIRGGSVSILANTGGLWNQGTIAQEGDAAMVIDPSHLGVNNPGSLVARGSGGLQLMLGVFFNQGGTISAEPGSFVAIGPGATLWGGTFTASGGGTLRPIGDGGNSSIFTDLTLDGPVDQRQDQDARIAGTVTNNATWTLEHTGTSGSSFIEFDDGARIDGPGVIDLHGGPNNVVYANNTVFTNGPTHTIRGGGQILASTGGLLNLGTITGSGSVPLSIQPNALGVRNAGLIEATSPAGLVFGIGTFFNAAGGHFVAHDGSVIEISVGATIRQALVESQGTGYFRLVGDGGNMPTLDTARLQGAVVQETSNDVTLMGYCQHTSSWNVSGNAGGTCDILLANGAFLAGPGEVQFTGNSVQRLVTNNTVGSHARGHVLRGHGMIMDGTGGLRNHGTMVAENGELVVDANGLGFENYGTLQASAGSTLRVADGAHFTNLGTMQVDATGVLAVNTRSLHQQAGTLALRGGGLTLGGTDPYVDLSGGTLHGNGTITGEVRSKAIVSPGNPIGRLSVTTAYSQLPGSVLEIALGGTTPQTQYDVLQIGQAAALGGRLNITRANAFAPSVGDTFTVLTGGSVTGEFDAITGRALGGGLFLQETYNPESVTLQAVQRQGLYAQDAFVTEGDTGSLTATFQVFLVPASGAEVSVKATVTDGTAFAGADYTNPGLKTLVFAPGQTVQTITVPVLGDTLPEPEEYLVVTLSEASGASIALETATGVILDNDSNDCDGDGIGDDYAITHGLVADVNMNGIPDTCDIGDGRSFDCNTNGIPDEAEPDCNRNGIPDDCDIASGFSEDADHNGAPDECSQHGAQGFQTY